MATLYITEFADAPVLKNGQAFGIGTLAPVAEQNITFTGTSAASAAFNAKTKFIRVHPDAICSIKCGPAPVAEATNLRMVAGQTEYFAVVPGDKIAAITNS